MDIFALVLAIISSTVFTLLYIKTYNEYFSFRKNYLVGVFLFLLSIYIQFFAFYLKIDLLLIALLSFITYPISISLIYETNLANKIFLSLNAILKIYITFSIFAAIFAIKNNVQYSYLWLNNSYYFNLSQALAYLLSTGSMLLADRFIIKKELNFFFKIKNNLYMVFLIQITILSNIILLTISNQILPHNWYNNIVLYSAVSFEVIYFLFRLYTAKSSFYSNYLTHVNSLQKQLEIQLGHYKEYEEQTKDFLKFKHDQEKIINTLLSLSKLYKYDKIENILKQYQKDLSYIDFNYQNYSNNNILDALINDYSKRFEKIGSAFSCYINFPITYISDLNLIKVFYNLFENIYEALLLINNANNRIVNIKSTILDNYLKISLVNTASSNLDLNVKTSKENVKNHGFGLQIISDILEEYDGFSNKYITEKDNLVYYNIEIFLPISSF